MSLSEAEIGKLWEAYQEKQSAQYVSEICAVSRNKMKVAEDIEKQLEFGNYKPTVRDYEQLLKLEESLKGSMDIRTKDSDPSKWKWLEEVEDE